MDPCLTYISVGEIEMEISGWMKNIFLKSKIFYNNQGYFKLTVSETTQFKISVFISISKFLDDRSVFLPLIRNLSPNYKFLLNTLDFFHSNYEDR